MRVINIIDRFDKVNFGVWNAAIAPAAWMDSKYSTVSEMWYPERLYPGETDILERKVNVSPKYIEQIIDDSGITPDDTVIVTHGCWQYPTKWGYRLKKLGFKWVYVPHAMLMPWCINQKSFAKKIYFNLFENRWGQSADAVRAVGYAEVEQLGEMFENTVQIPNGITAKEFSEKNWNQDRYNFLYLARIHKVKGVDHLIEGWAESKLCNNPKYKLTLAGPDDGELPNIKKIIQKHSITNVEYVGSVYGDEKQELLKNSHFFVMPSLTEGFSSSIVEVAQQGCIPIISDGCNLPHFFEEKIAFKANPEKHYIKNTLNHVATLLPNEFASMSAKAHKIATANYSLEVIADKQYKLYSGLLNGNN